MRFPAGLSGISGRSKGTGSAVPSLRPLLSMKGKIMNAVRNARFWAWVNGWVKITLHPGQTLGYWRGGRNEEGWSFFSECWEHVGNGVERNWSDEGRDCDGRLDRSGEDFCPLAELAAVEQGNASPGISTPRWDRVTAAQRDYNAELAGY